MKLLDKNSRHTNETPYKILILTRRPSYFHKSWKKNKYMYYPRVTPMSFIHVVCFECQVGTCMWTGLIYRLMVGEEECTVSFNISPKIQKLFKLNLIKLCMYHLAHVCKKRNKLCTFNLFPKWNNYFNNMSYFLD